MIMVTIGVVCLIALFIVSRLVSMRAIKYLSDDQKRMLVAVFGSTRKISLILLSVIIVAFLVVAYNFQVDKAIAVYAYFSALMLCLVTINVINLNKIKQLDFPEPFVKKNQMATFLRLLGVAILLVCMADYLIHNMNELGQRQM